MLIKVRVHSEPFHYVSISEWQQRVNSQITSVPFGGDYTGDPRHSTILSPASTAVSNSQHQITQVLFIERVFVLPGTCMSLAHSQKKWLLPGFQAGDQGDSFDTEGAPRIKNRWSCTFNADSRTAKQSACWLCIFFFLQKWNTDYLKGNYFLNDAHYMHLIVFIAS